MRAGNYAACQLREWRRRSPTCEIVRHRLQARSCGPQPLVLHRSVLAGRLVGITTASWCVGHRDEMASMRERTGDVFVGQTHLGQMARALLATQRSGAVEKRRLMIGVFARQIARPSSQGDPYSVIAREARQSESSFPSPFFRAGFTVQASRYCMSTVTGYAIAPLSCRTNCGPMSLCLHFFNLSG